VGGPRRRISAMVAAARVLPPRTLTSRQATPCAEGARLQPLAPTQMVVSDPHGLNTREHQPAKIAAIKALWKLSAAPRLCCLRCPPKNCAASTTRWNFRSLRARSLHDAAGEPSGLVACAAGATGIYAFRLMVGVGVLMLV
jgi:cytochrome d ubiquinol oxidase subunit I